jgi:hypothetical protein
VLLVVGALVTLAAGVIAGRYVSWYGVIPLAAFVLMLGFGWEWQADGMVLLVPIALAGALGLAVGIYRRRRIRREERALVATL